MEEERIKITVVGAVVIALVVIGAVVLIRYLNKRLRDSTGEEIFHT